MDHGWGMIDMTPVSELIYETWPWVKCWDNSKGQGHKRFFFLQKWENTYELLGRKSISKISHKYCGTCDCDNFQFDFFLIFQIFIFCHSFILTKGDSLKREFSEQRKYLLTHGYLVTRAKSILYYGTRLAVLCGMQDSVVF